MMCELADLHADDLGGGVVLKQRLVVLVLQKILVRPRLSQKPSVQLISYSATAEEATDADRQPVTCSELYFSRFAARQPDCATSLPPSSLAVGYPSAVGCRLLQATEALSETLMSHVPEQRVRRRCLGRSVPEALLARVAGPAYLQASPWRRWCLRRSTRSCTHSQRPLCEPQAMQ
jgi:hypothetical protein